MPGAIHEWFGVADTAGAWTPPLCLLAHLALQAARRAAAAGRGGQVVWIGRRVWPYLWVLNPDGPVVSPDLRSRCGFFVDSTTAADRLWALDLALRSGAVAAVVADGSGLNMAAARRLQLAAEAGGSMGLLARPPNEQGQLSAAATRWRVCVQPSETDHPRWAVQLLHCKGAWGKRSTSNDDLILEWNGATGTVAIPAHVARRSGKEANPARKLRRTA